MAKTTAAAAPTPNIRTLTRTWLLGFAVVLAACGGGGGDDPPVNTPSFRVGGQLAGLGAGKTVVITDASGPSAAVSANGSYSLQLPAGTAYSRRIAAQPVGQTCTIANGSGTVSADVNNVSVACRDNDVPPNARTLGGSVAGLATGKALVLQLAAGGATQEARVTADGPFTFAQPVTGPYSISVLTQPQNQTCTVTGGQGTVDASAALPPITVACATTGYRLSGTVSGNIGVVALRNNANGDTVTVVDNGAFRFAQPVLAGMGYAVSVFDSSAGQSCSVSGGTGVATADVTQMAVVCVVDAPPPPPPVVVVPGIPALMLAYDVKTFKLSWGAIAPPAGGGAITYRVTEDPDGAGPAAATQIATGLTGTSYDRVVTGLLHTRLNATYRVQACNSAGCSALSAAQTVNLTQAIGYFKASNTEPNDYFGYRVALSGDGNTLAVGAYQEDSNATGIDGNQADNSVGSAGAVYVFTRSGSTWSQQAYVKASNTGVNDYFGYSVALSSNGNTLAVGAYVERSNATGIDGNQADNSAPGAGAAYVFTRSGSTWSQQAYVKASNTEAGDAFGISVALSGDGNTLAVGAVGEGSIATGIDGDQADNSAGSAGAVYVFARSGSTWSQQAYVKASNTGAVDAFGVSVALSGDGNTLAVGAMREASNATGIDGNQADNSAFNAGAVYVFARSGSTWSQQAYVKASNAWANDYFGASLALSGDGNTLAAGAHTEASNATGTNGNQADNSTIAAGAVYMFTRSGSTWSQQAYVKASNTGEGDQFGWSVALSGDGNTLAVGAYGERGNATGINGNQVDNSASLAGAVYVFTRSGSAWSQQAYVKAGNTGAYDSFGTSVALSGDGNILAVGANLEASNATGTNGNPADNSAGASGAVYVY
ncbi:FG-GAP repeat protein [Acidovorax sp. FHTAMBA]|jgi:hypothetical protein|uniref:beta strand repeat-containing protein n=1 Tax=Acidovorax sp. FHTAMBA TaxID=3140252 RepID=UPI001C70DC6E